MPSRRRVSSALLLFVAPVTLLAGCEPPTAPQAIEEAMRLERDVASGKAASLNFASRFGLLQKMGEAGRLRVIRDGVEVEYWAFVFDRDYTPSHGNDPRSPYDRRSATVMAWRAEDPRDYFFMRAAVARADFVPFRIAWGAEGPPPRPWLLYGDTWIGSSGQGEIARLDDSTSTCDGLVDYATDQWVRNDFTSYHGHGIFPDDFGPDPRITCARARFTVSATAVMQQGIWGPSKTPPGWNVVTGFTPGERRLEIPPQTVPGTRLVIECNGTVQSAVVGCGPSTRPLPPEIRDGRPVPRAP